MIKIICIGNRSLDSDAAGLLVYDQLAERQLPDGVELVDGGLAGLNLLGQVEGCERVIFVDSVSGFGKPGEVVMIKNVSELLDRPDGLDHGAGLGYLLPMIDMVTEGTPPEVMVVGVESPCSEAALWRAVEMATVAATITADLVVPQFANNQSFLEQFQEKASTEEELRKTVMPAATTC